MPEAQTVIKMAQAYGKKLDSSFSIKMKDYQDKVADWILLGGGRLTSVYWFWSLLIIALLPIWWRIKKNSTRRVGFHPNQTSP